MNKIKPCPFCGTEVELSKNPLWHGGHGYYNCFEFEIVCPTCGCNVRYDKNDTIYRAEEEAIQNVIETWNKRDESNNTITIEKIKEEIMDTGAYEQEVHGKTEFLEAINYCLNVIDEYKTENKDECKKCEYYINPDYIRCQKCKVKSRNAK